MASEFRSAHGIEYGVWLPEILYLGFVRFVQALCALCRWLSLARSVAYLLAVSVIASDDASDVPLTASDDL